MALSKSRKVGLLLAALVLLLTGLLSGCGGHTCRDNSTSHSTGCDDLGD
jgi:hypothetical protein